MFLLCRNLGLPGKDDRRRILKIHRQYCSDFKSLLNEIFKFLYLCAAALKRRQEQQFIENVELRKVLVEELQFEEEKE